MKKCLKVPVSLFIFLFTFLLTGNILGQGKIIKTSEADALFGPVLKSEKVNVHQLKMILLKTPQRVLFGFKKGRVHILDKDRKEEYNSDDAIENNDVFHLYSTNVVEELINQEKGSEVMVEERANNIMTITTSSTVGGVSLTLEFALLCPPNCL